jgi:hypothetical protein
MDEDDTEEEIMLQLCFFSNEAYISNWRIGNFFHCIGYNPISLSLSDCH